MKANTNINMKKLVVRVAIRYLSSILIVGFVLFITAWSFNYWNAWIFMCILFIPMAFVMIYLLTNDPELLEKRIQAKEKEQEQKTVLKLGSIFLLAGFLIPGFDYRFQWSALPLWIVVISSVVFLIGYIMFFIVMKQNSYASRTVEIQNNQKIIDTGLYGIVRHPMYTAMLLIYFFAPLVLGSFYAVIPFIAWPFILAYRIKNEEEVLRNGLEGYIEYTQRVKYRLIPYVW
jgi:protein-S-isoprenylcysteine O-methyltransferase Ste14